MDSMSTAAPIDNFEHPRELDFIDIRDVDSFEPLNVLGSTKYKADLGGRAKLKAFLTNQGSDVLLVSLHGATARDRFELPRFEWFRTLRKTRFSALYFSDPTLDLNEKLELAWYTGWQDLDLYPILATWAVKAAEAVGASKIVFFGSSGGGLAALQVATFVPGSLAMPFSPQTSIANYKVWGWDLKPQRRYIEVVMPHLAPDGGVQEVQGEVDWSTPLGERTSALRRYSREQPNMVFYVQNNNDLTHVEQHYEPFRKVVESSVNQSRVKFLNYDGAPRHNPPKPSEFQRALGQALEWMRGH